MEGGALGQERVNLGALSCLHSFFEIHSFIYGVNTYLSNAESFARLCSECWGFSYERLSSRTQHSSRDVLNRQVFLVNALGSWRASKVRLDSAF